MGIEPKFAVSNKKWQTTYNDNWQEIIGWSFVTKQCIFRKRWIDTLHDTKAIGTEKSIAFIVHSYNGPHNVATHEKAVLLPPFPSFSVFLGLSISLVFRETLDEAVVSVTEPLRAL